MKQMHNINIVTPEVVSSMNKIKWEREYWSNIGVLEKEILE